MSFPCPARAGSPAPARRERHVATDPTALDAPSGSAGAGPRPRRRAVALPRGPRARPARDHCWQLSDRSRCSNVSRNWVGWAEQSNILRVSRFGEALGGSARSLDGHTAILDHDPGTLARALLTADVGPGLEGTRVSLLLGLPQQLAAVLRRDPLRDGSASGLSRRSCRPSVSRRRRTPRPADKGFPQSRYKLRTGLRGRA